MYLHCRTVHVIKLISRDSIEACMLRVGQEKLKLEQDMTNDGGECPWIQTLSNLQVTIYKMNFKIPPLPGLVHGIFKMLSLYCICHFAAMSMKHFHII